MNASMFFKSQLNFFCLEDMHKSPESSHFSLLRALLRQLDPEARGYLLGLLRIIRMFLRSDRSWSARGDIRRLLRSTIRPLRSLIAKHFRPFPPSL